MAPDALTCCACATTIGGSHALIRLSGPQARCVAETAGLSIPKAWTHHQTVWDLTGTGGPGTPVTMVWYPAGRSFTGWDLVEILLPGNRFLVELALQRLIAWGARQALPGAFTRMALARGRLRLDQAEAILALTQAEDEDEVRHGLSRLSGALGGEVAVVRSRLLELRAAVEAGLDFIEEPDVRAYDAAHLQRELTTLRAVLGRWHRATTRLTTTPRVALAGPANAGKSALFTALTGSPALVSEQAGTTRDWLEAPWDLGSRQVTLVDTAGWMGPADRVSLAADQASQAELHHMRLILVCSAADAPAPDPVPIPAGVPILILATKADLPVAADPRAVLAISAHTGQGLVPLADLVARRLAGSGGGDPRQQELLAAVDTILARLCDLLPTDELLADDLATAARHLGDLIGEQAPDEVLDRIFSRFCIGK